ncbi:MAG: hypothetical protein HW412_407 [Bacteroidetes bacterium]|nr:hypothetical protein [Bacteroidota bacterium]
MFSRPWLKHFRAGLSVTRLHHAVFVVLVFLLFASCNEKLADIARGNKTPKTFLWLYPPPDSGIGVGVSRQRLHWWGEDPDGIVRGFLFAFDTLPGRITSIPHPDPFRYTWVTTNDTLMAFPLRSLFQEFTVVVRSVDNLFAGLPLHSIVRLSPSPYLDANDNGVFDTGDQPLPAIVSALDPTGAIQTFPIRNTPPILELALSPSDPTRVMKIPDTTYTAITVSFKGLDDDGNNTLAAYRIALNDTSTPSRWLTVPLRDTVVTLLVPRLRSDGRASGDTVSADAYGGSFLGRHLIGTVPGLRLDSPNKVFIQVRDIAGEYSPVLILPSGTDRWFVRKPNGRLLLVSDYITTQFDNPIPKYLASLAAVPGGEFATVDLLDIGRGPAGQTIQDRARDKLNGIPGALVPAFIDPALINTFLLYDYVLWYTDRFPSLGVAQLSLFTYMQNGGKVVFSANFLNLTDPRGAIQDFAPVDSIDTENLPPAQLPARGSSTIPARYRVIPDDSDPTNIYPQLALDSIPVIHSIFMRPVYRRSDARYIYHLQADTASNPQLYTGMPNIGVVDGEKRIVFMGIPLHLLNNGVNGNPQGLAAFFTKVFTGQFSPYQRVNRRKF